MSDVEKQIRQDPEAAVEKIKDPFLEIQILTRERNEAIETALRLAVELKTLKDALQFARDNALFSELSQDSLESLLIGTEKIALSIDAKIQLRLRKALGEIK
jgi:hypothetical protein